MKKVILASQSKQRIEILGKFIKNLRHVSPDIDESFNTNFDTITNSMSISKRKVEFLTEKYPRDIIIGSDTVVIYENRIFGKPKDKEDAKRIIKILSGKMHEVLSSFCIMEKESKITICDYTVSKVNFRILTEAQIESFIETGDWEGRAGAYAIQDSASSFVSHIEGDYMGIIGLPISKIADYLFKYFDYDILKDC